MKYEATTDINIKRNPQSKIYYFVRGSIEHSLRTTDWSEALLKKKFKMAEIDGSGMVAMKHKVGDLYKLGYLDDKKKQATGKLKGKKIISPGTLNEIEYVFESHLLPFFKAKSLAQVNSVLWSKYCSNATVSDLANHRKVFQGFFKWAKRKGYILSLPDLTEIPYHKRRRRRIIKPQELEAIFTHAHGSLFLFLHIALYYGLRRKEIITLGWAGIDLAERFITVEGAFNKKRRMRSIPITDQTVGLLEARKASTGKSPWVFPNAKDPKRHADVTGLKGSWSRCLAKAKLKEITWHDFRATFEKHMNSSVNFTDMQKEKFADASLRVQSSIYVNMDHDDLRGLENSVSLPKIEEITRGKSLGSGKTGVDE